MQGPGRSDVRVLALLYALGGLLCLAAARWPLDPESPVALARALGLVGLGASVLLLVLGRRWPSRVVHAGFAALGALVGLIAAASVTPQGVVGLGPVLIAASLHAAHAFTATAARVHVALLCAAATAGAVASSAEGSPVPWAINVVTAVVVAEVHGLLLRRLRAAASTDPLTGVANRRAWEEAASRHLLGGAGAHPPLTVVIIDLDGFKQVNDTRGHAAGDALLRELPARWAPELRRGDLLGRYGGDEFVLCLPATDPQDAEALVARLRERHAMPWSAGTAAARRGDSLDAVLARADDDLYAQKRRAAGGVAAPR